jgi:hypothetical protein
MTRLVRPWNVGLCEAKTIPVIGNLDSRVPLVHSLEANPHKADGALGSIRNALGAEPHAGQPEYVESSETAAVMKELQPRASRSSFEAHMRGTVVDCVLQQLEQVQIVTRKLLL